MDAAAADLADLAGPRLATAAAALCVSVLASIALSALLVRTSFRSHCPAGQDTQGTSPAGGESESESACEASSFAEPSARLR